MSTLIPLRRAALKSIHFRKSHFTKATRMDANSSGLTRIDSITEDPVDLFRLWHSEVRRYTPEKPDVCCLATVSKDAKVSARNVVLREFDNEGFVIVTDNRSRKVSDMESNPDVAMCFLWDYFNDENQHVARQVRIEGKMQKLLPDNFQRLYDREPLFCKIRSHICDQGKSVDWDELKNRHDKLLEDVLNKKTNLPMPAHFVGYKLLPTMMEFYFARDMLIGDRIHYKKDVETNSWEHRRIAA